MAIYTKLKYYKWSSDSSWELVKDARNYSYLSLMGTFYLLQTPKFNIITLSLKINLAASLLFVLFSLWFQLAEHESIKSKTHSENTEFIKALEDEFIINNEGSWAYTIIYWILELLFLTQTILLFRIGYKVLFII